MSFSTYANGAIHIARELKHLLTAEKFQPFLREIPADWDERIGDLRRRVDSENVALTLASATPAKREKILKKYLLDQQFWLIAAATQIAQESAHTLFAIGDHLQAGSSYRDMIARVQLVLQAPYNSPFYLWPFPVDHPDVQADEGA